MEEAYAETRLYDQVRKVVSLALDHARMTKRLEAGSSWIPGFEIEQTEDIVVPVLESKRQQKRKDRRGSPSKRITGGKKTSL